jgi:hypothetical protein
MAEGTSASVAPPVKRQNLSEAQLILCREQLRRSVCPVCEAWKRANQCFCRKCYFALPTPMRLALWMDRMDHASLIEWSEKYAVAKDYLRRLGMDERSGDLFETIS